MFCSATRQAWRKTIIANHSVLVAKQNFRHIAKGVTSGLNVRDFGRHG